MGCSNPHPHGQIWAQRSIPQEVEKKVVRQKNYWEQNNSSLLGDYLKQERNAKERIVLQNESFVVLVPYWAVWPFETMLIAPQLGSLGQVFQFIQEYTGVVSPGILAVFLMGLFYKKATNNAAIWGVILSIPIAMYFKVAPNGWSDAAMFVNIPFMHQMMLTCIGTILVIAGISKLEGNQDDPKGIVLSKQLFATDKTFNVAAFGVLLITALLYALFW